MLSLVLISTSMCMVAMAFACYSSNFPRSERKVPIYLLPWLVHCRASATLSSLSLLETATTVLVIARAKKFLIS
jgi:hypothetical protein